MQVDALRNETFVTVNTLIMTSKGCYTRFKTRMDIVLSLIKTVLVVTK